MNISQLFNNLKDPEQIGISGSHSDSRIECRRLRVRAGKKKNDFWKSKSQNYGKVVVKCPIDILNKGKTMENIVKKTKIVDNLRNIKLVFSKCNSH